MKQKQQGAVDILEIYHARQVRDEMVSQLRRLHQDTQQSPLPDQMRRQDVQSYYEAMLITVAELLHGLGDQPIH